MHRDYFGRSGLNSSIQSSGSLAVLAETGGPMEDNERWKELCSLASTEQDPDKLLALVEEINRLLDEREQRLRRNQSSNPIP